jgi:hypothetical protein
VDGEPDVADVGPVDEARGDHPPADRALQGAEREDEAELPAIAARDRPLPREPQQGQSESEADDPAEQPVDIFPEIDALEVLEAHSAVDELILRALPVGGELGRPGLLPERRKGSRKRLPANDREAGFGQPGDPPDDDHQEDEGGDGEQPQGDGAGPGFGRDGLEGH